MLKNIIVARAQNNVIGKDNQLLWHISEDLRHFKSLTMGSPIIMGRKTYESIGKPLPGRTNIVITSGEIKDDGVISVHSLDEAYKKAEEVADAPYGSGEVFVIGGGSIYKQAMERNDVDYINMTVVYKDFEGDVYFPEIDTDQWDIIDSSEIKEDEKIGLKYRFVTLSKIYDNHL